MTFTVGPGNQTGVYYLLLFSIKKGATWRDLKDYARGCGLELDYAEVYDRNFGGWVRTFSIDAFRQACSE